MRRTHVEWCEPPKPLPPGRSSSSRSRPTSWSRPGSSPMPPLRWCRARRRRAPTGSSRPAPRCAACRSGSCSTTRSPPTRASTSRCAPTRAGVAPRAARRRRARPVACRHPDSRPRGSPGSRRGRGARHRRAGGRRTDTRLRQRLRPKGVATSFGALAPASRWWFPDGRAVANSQQWVAFTGSGPDRCAECRGAGFDRHRNRQPGVDRSVGHRELGAGRRLRPHDQELPGGA